MSAERLLAWSAAVAATAVFSLAFLTDLTVGGRLPLVALSILVAVPLAVVFVGWLSAVRGGERGWS
ncbi:hypothetical protein [Natronomonas gomsonensis]|uniref:hypothetical protein n=1 Tax=Natronomonas gomsonensis TaxID=1046043 RepID=UPI0015B98F5B|nr:hypothetical protein [Natronomonas gomsonensis]